MRKRTEEMKTERESEREIVSVTERNRDTLNSNPRKKANEVIGSSLDMEANFVNEFVFRDQGEFL